jgi:hypothetical protein
VGLQSLSVTPRLVPPANPDKTSKKDADDEEDGLAGNGNEPAASPDAGAGAAQEAPAPSQYALRFYFAEPDDLEPGDRVFSISLQGKPVVDHLDIVKEANGPRAVLVKEVTGVQITESLQIDFVSAPSSKHPPVLCGLELIGEDQRRLAVTP